MNAVTEAQYLQPQLGLAAIPPQFQQLTLDYDLDTHSAWTCLKPHGRACFTLGLLSDLAKRDRYFRANRHQAWINARVFPIEYQVVASAHPGVFSFGGDLALFVMLIKARDRQALFDYARACVELTWQRLTHYDGSATTISVVEGDALGGGFECALTSDIIIAEQQVRMGFPEILFNLFPGMGAYSLLTRRLGARQAEEMITSGELYSAQALKELGVVDLVVPAGSGRKAAFHYMADNHKRANGMRGIFRCREFANPVSLEEMLAICGVWADAALQLKDRDLRMMQRLVKAQIRQDSQTERQSGIESGDGGPEIFHPMPEQVEVELC